MTYIDHFKKQSDQYLRFRPDYPETLFAFLADKIDEHEWAWDCATGNGQAAVPLSRYFARVIATDINQEQLDRAWLTQNIRYLCTSAEKTPIADHSIDLITVAQALHWFNFDAFYDEVRRVSKPGALFAAWSYGLGSFNNALDKPVIRLYRDILGDQYWPPERRYIDDAYETIPFPFKKEKTGQWAMEKSMRFEHLLGYLNTWSAVKEYEQRNHGNPIDLVVEELKQAWGDPENHHVLHWPLYLLVGYVK